MYNIIIINILLLTASGFLPSGSGAAIRHNTQIKYSKHKVL